MAKIIGASLPNMPWQDKPKDCQDPMWRYEKNPIVTRHNLKGARSIFNSAVVPFEDGWNCSIHHNNKNIIIHIISNSDDGFIFNSTEV